MPAPKVFAFYYVDGSFIARVNRSTLEAEVYRRGQWAPYWGRVDEILMGGHEVSEQQAMAFARKREGGG